MNSNIIRNRLISVGHTLLLGLSFFFGQAQATGATYDGIYQWSPGNFLSVHQDGTQMIATIYFNNDGSYSFPAPAGGGVLPVPTLDLFDLMHGDVTGSTAQMDGTRFHRECNVGYDFTFNNDATITVTRIGVSNTPAADSAHISCSSIVGMEAATMIVPKIRFGPNSAPVANAGSAQNVVVGTLVTLDGSASTDADGNALTYAWTLTTKPAGSAASLSSATSVKPTFIADVAGTYVASLIVNDGTVNSNAATVAITATAPAIVAPVVKNATLYCYKPYSSLSTEYMDYSFTLTNNQNYAIGRIYYDLVFTVSTAAIPLIATASFYTDISGGLAVGATRDFNFEPNMFSDFTIKSQPFCHDSARLLSVKIKSATDGGGLVHTF